LRKDSMRACIVDFSIFFTSLKKYFILLSNKKQGKYIDKNY